MNPLRRSPHSHLLQIPARPWLRRLAADSAVPSLDRVPEAALDSIAGHGFHGVWLMGVWRTGPIGRRLALDDDSLRARYNEVLPGWTEDDVSGSPYSIAAYEPAPEIGGADALARFRARLHERHVGLMLDFVPNHVGRDHAWLDEHPERLVTGTEEDLRRAPDGWFRHDGPGGSRIFGHGRDPNFPGWTDTVQVEYRRRETRAAMTRLLADVASRCDGVRCDVAMLLLEDVFRKTWGDLPDGEPGCFWTEAITELRRDGADTVLLAEAYGGTEPRLIAAGFDYAYDKGLYDLLLANDAEHARFHLSGAWNDPARGAHFLENHDEARAMAAFGPERLRAAAVATFSAPGMRFFDEGQDEGRAVRVPVQLAREPREPVVEWCRTFHHQLWRILSEDVFHRGTWSPAEIRAPGDGEPVPPLVGSRWAHGRDHRIVLANISGGDAYGRVPWPLPPGGPDALTLVDELSGERFERSRNEMREPGLFVKLEPWGTHFLRLRDDPG
jgi:hypothetical protein